MEGEVIEGDRGSVQKGPQEDVFFVVIAGKRFAEDESARHIGGLEYAGYVV